MKESSECLCEFTRGGERSAKLSISIALSLALGLTIAALMIPATEVGGDYYDVIPTDNGLLIPRPACAPKTLTTLAIIAIRHSLKCSSA